MSESHTYSKRYSDNDLRLKAIHALEWITHGDQLGIQFVLILSQITGMHPQIVVQRIEYLAALKE